jgi:hypothetical protein
MGDGPRSGRAHWLVGAPAAVQLLGVAAAAFGLQGGAAPAPEPPFVVCQDQEYALCAAARCFVYDGVAYCRCDVENGDSISLQLAFTTAAGERDVCDVNRQGRTNGYMVSTFSLPPDVLKGGDAAVYTCPGSANAGDGVPAPVAYGQCDGGICFRSTSGNRFPGFPDELQGDEIICSCPISTASTPGSTDPLGYQVFGPYHPQAPPGSRCDPSGCALCSVASPEANGSTIPVGAATGVGKFLATRLDGAVPKINECPCVCATGSDGTTTCTPASAAGPSGDPPPVPPTPTGPG